MEWTSVSERLPPPGDYIVYFHSQWDESKRCEVGSLLFNGKEWTWDDSYSGHGFVVTHWMPLPPPPSFEAGATAGRRG